MTTPEADTSPPVARGRGFTRILTGSMAGAVLEWYDFAVYGILAATVLGELFFPGNDPTVKLLLALATHGIGFLARPLGGVVFGHFGDRFGRKPMLVVTFLLLGTATAAIGLLPTYAHIGIWATAALVLLRLVQGFALGGEFGAAVLLVGEYGDAKRRGFWTSWPQAGGPLGTLLASGVVTVITLLAPGDALAAWGWRLAFLVAIPLLVIGFWIRKGVEESPVFSAAQARAAARGEPAPRRSSILDALARPRAVLHGLGVRLGENIAFYIYTVFVIAYAAKDFDYTRGEVLLAVTFASGFQFAGMIVGGAWSDRVGRKLALIVPAVALIVWAPVFFWLVGMNSLPALWVGVSIGAFFHGLLAGPEAAWIAELFPTRHRFAGASLVFQGSSIVAGAPAPLVAVWLVGNFGVAAVVTYLVVTMAVAGLAVATHRETRAADLAEIS